MGRFANHASRLDIGFAKGAQCDLSCTGGSKDKFGNHRTYNLHYSSLTSHDP